MNDRMYRDPATQANLATLRQRGVTVIEPEEGALASRGEHGVGRLPEPRALLDAIEHAVPGPSGPWDGLRVLISAGGTREPIDPVRFIGNRSSGRMGFAIAEQAARRGAEVTLVAANVTLPAPAGVRRVDVETAADLAGALDREFDSADVLVMAAAPADFARLEQPTRRSTARARKLELDLEATEDILAGSRPTADGQTIIGFAAETDSELDRAREKLARKGADAIVLNDVSRSEIGFESSDNEVVIVERDGEHHVPLASKEEIADAILDRSRRSGPLATRRAERSSRPDRSACPPSYTGCVAQDERSQAGESSTLYRRGMELLEDGDFEEATVPSEAAARRPRRAPCARRSAAPCSEAATTRRPRPSSRRSSRPTR
jgi:phosphopantothenoylcysteine decarboxylase/phosphopantothenate--cysteine ligase